jgi:hypothetical protein
MAAHAALDPDLSPSISNPQTSANANPITPDQKSWHQALHHYLRWALVGGAPGPSSAATMELLDRDVCVQRIQEANKVIIAQEAAEKAKATRAEIGIRPIKIESFGGAGAGAGSGSAS